MKSNVYSLNDYKGLALIYTLNKGQLKSRRPLKRFKEQDLKAAELEYMLDPTLDEILDEIPENLSLYRR